MGPLRIVILLVLLYILYRLVARPRARRTGTPRARQACGTVTDVLEEDPVCHVCIPRAQAVTMRIGDETVYFCSRECLARYRETRKNNREKT